MAVKKWWHYVIPREFYYCQVLGGGPPLVKHSRRNKARREAARLAVVTGLPVYIIRSVEVVLPAQPAPAPRLAIHSYEGALTAYANYPKELPG